MNDNLNDRVRTILAERYNIEIGSLDVFPGTNPDASPEDIAAEIVKSLQDIAAGNSEEIDWESEEDEAQFKSFFVNDGKLNLGMV